MKNLYIKNEAKKNDLELFKKDEEIIDVEEDDDEDEELTSSNEMPLCAKIGLGLLRLAVIGYGVCKFSESKSSDSLPFEDGDWADPFN